MMRGRVGHGDHPTGPTGIAFLPSVTRVALRSLLLLAVLCGAVIVGLLAMHSPGVGGFVKTARVVATGRNSPLGVAQPPPSLLALCVDRR